jgi:hypothetical protein
VPSVAFAVTQLPSVHATVWQTGGVGHWVTSWQAQVRRPVKSFGAQKWLQQLACSRQTLPVGLHAAAWT